ncbi:MAG: hypothetical protein AAFN81_13210 [Bacteroidota bacterium]
MSSIIRTTFFSTLLLLILAGCKTADIRTDYALQNQTSDDFTKGRQLLEETYLAMGYDKFADVNTYEVKSVFDWKMPWGMMPMNALPGNKNNEILFRFTPNSFDGQVTFLEGRKEGQTYGLQSWELYHQKPGGEPTPKNNKRYGWGLPTYHYVIEAPMRLLQAEIIRYAGEAEFEGQQYDLVYATWGQDAPHKEHDQWLVYINKETKMVDLTEITINDFFLPMPAGLKDGTIRVERSLTSQGVYLPNLVTIQLGDPKKQKKHVYTFSLTDYQFNTFQQEELYPLEALAPVGDTKPISK